MYGGAAGGGKSVALLAGALQHVTVPGYSALLLRRTFADLNLPGALIPLSHEWLQGTDAKWDGNEHRWTFPIGATVTFGYLQTDVDKYRYQSSAFQYIGFDELTQFTRPMYLYPFSRLRKPEGMTVPLRVRSATNPGGAGHEWVRERFLDAKEPGRRFIPASLEDNPFLDRVAYEASLAELDPVTRAQLRHGDWQVRPEGNLFKRQWFTTLDPGRVPALTEVVRAWDLAATADAEADDPDYLAGVKIGRDDDKNYYVLHVIRERLTPEGVEKVVRSTASVDGRGVKVRIEQEGAASGKIVRSHFTRLLDGYDARFTGIPRQAKLVRAGPFSAACESGRVFLVRGKWNEAYLDELCLAKGTKVATMRGEVPIEEVTTSDHVPTRKGWKRVIRAELTNPAATLCEIRTDDGNSICATLNHPIAVAGCGFTRAGLLRAGDGLLRFIGASLSGSTPIRRNDILAGGSTVGTSSCNATFGSVSAGRYQTAFTFTMRTRTRRTTRSITCGVSPLRLTLPSIGQSLPPGSCETPSAPYAAASSRLPKPDARKLVPAGAETVGSRRWGTKTSTNDLARCVAATSEPLRLPQSIARFGVPSELSTITASCPKSPAGGAVNCSSRKLPPVSFAADVVVSALFTLPGKHPVYNLEVEGCHEFVANGLLVHNCAFPQEGVHDDMVDASSNGYHQLSAGARQLTGNDWRTVASYNQADNTREAMMRLASGG